MVKFALSLILSFTFAASAGVCGVSACSFDSGKNISKTCDETSRPTGSDSKNSDVDHCALHCSHSVNASIPSVTLKLSVEIKSEVKFNYFFAYQSPTLDAIERPPLSC